MNSPVDDYEEWKAMQDNDGYPTEEQLEKLRTWKWKDYTGLMEYVRGIWHWGIPDKNIEHVKDDFDNDVIRYTMATGGWSGNESIIGALSDNFIFWSTCWVQSSRGGGYIFEVRNIT